jgi:AcrR family transcriptional regulator
MTQTAEAHTADRIRDTAACSFAERGFGATSMRDIARVVGVTPGAIYNHFASKEALLYAIALESHRGLLRTLEHARHNGDPSAAASFDRLITAMIDYTLAHAVATQASSREYSHLARTHLARIVEIRRQILTMLESVLQDGIASGDFRLPGSSAGAVRRIATSIVNMLISISDSTQPDGRLPAEETRNIHRELVRRMISGTDGDGAARRRSAAT